MTKQKTASFQTQGRLLQELGERLVAKADVALTELIKNAYDADASECRVNFKDDILEISDDGHGMNEVDFLNKWMNIATPDKQRERESRLYKRKVTGSKGIGRFAVRFLGRHLRLETVAEQPGGHDKILLSIDFDWEKLDKAPNLNAVAIPYYIQAAEPRRKIGTRLIISEIRNPDEISFTKGMRTELLSIIDPFSGLESGGFRRKGKSKLDQGFKVILPGSEESDESNLMNDILNNAYARLTINHDGSKAIYQVKHKDGRLLLNQIRKTPKTNIEKGFFADIRFCPRRAGMFQNTGVDGRVVWGWLREHGGIGIVDHGFRIRPYGFLDDDWLNLSLDSGHSRREWRVAFMNDLFPMPPEASSNAKSNPMLYLPKFTQLIGAVFVESSQDFNSERPTDLTPSMDREGFIDNEGFRELHELVRAGLEMLAYADHEEQRRIEKQKADQLVKEMRMDFKEAAKYVAKIPTLSEGDKTQIIQHFQTLEKELDDVQEYNKIATSKMETVALLGVLSGFLTHEMKRLISDLDEVLRGLGKIKSNLGGSELLERIKRTRDEIEGQIVFASTFIDNVQGPMQNIIPLNVRAQVDRVLDRFRYFTEDRDVQIECDIEDNLFTPPIPVAFYSGVILNLYTNALKAVFGGQGSTPEPKVVIKSWNEPKYHFIEVADSGIGIPENLRKRIWDPLFTTTSGGSSNPLGSGMGLGLALVKKLLSEVKGSIDLVDPPPGYSTCFRVKVPRN